jgi:hypothetical protein
VGHPGHELRLFHWLERARPRVSIITDGSGSGHSRIEASRRLLHATGSMPGPLMGLFTDSEIYEAILGCDVASVAAATQLLATALIEDHVQLVVSDAFEFYNPTHDLCSLMARLAVSHAEAGAGNVIEHYDYEVTTATSRPGIVFALDDETVSRKIEAAHRFDHLTRDVNELLKTVGRDDLAREILHPVSKGLELPLPLQKPLYETHGEERVKAGRYRTVLRYYEHFVPFVEALATALGAELVAHPAQAVRS